MEIFDPQTMQKDCRSLIVGRIACGKYSLLKDLLYQFRNRFKHTYHTSAAPYEQQLTCKQCSFVDVFMNKSGLYLKKITEPTCLVVSTDRNNPKSLKCLINESRHLNLTLFFSVRTPIKWYGILKAENIRYIFCFRSDETELFWLYNKFFTNVFTSFSLYLNTLELLQRHECLVLDIMTLRLYTYKASIMIPRHIIHENCPDPTLCDDDFKVRSMLINMLSTKCVRTVANMIIDFLHPAKHYPLFFG